MESDWHEKMPNSLQNQEKSKIIPHMLAYVGIFFIQIVTSVLPAGPTEVTVQRCCKYQVLAQNH